jgi:hypothetical protein
MFSTAIAKILPRLDIEIVKRSDQAKGFVKWRSAGASKGRSRG